MNTRPIRRGLTSIWSQVWHRAGAQLGQGGRLPSADEEKFANMQLTCLGIFRHSEPHSSSPRKTKVLYLKETAAAISCLQPSILWFANSNFFL